MATFPTDDVLGIDSGKEIMRRIAMALERIADALESKRNDAKRVGTPFPWSAMSTRTRTAVRRYVLREIERGSALYRGMEWPLTCEDIRNLGGDELLESKNFGIMGWVEIVKKLNEMGMWQNANRPS